MTGFNLAVAIAGGTVLLLGLVAGYIKNRLWMAETTVCLLTGIVIGPAVLGFADIAALEVERFFLLKEVARLTLGMAVMGAALRLPARFVVRHPAGLGAVLGLGLPLMWLSSAALDFILLDHSLLVALLIGAALAPTDPVVAGSVVTGKIAGRLIPRRLRHLLTAESGANDGLALLIIMLPILLLQHSTPQPLTEWLTRVLLWEILGAVAMGVAAGWLAGRILVWAYRQPFSESHSTVTVALALALTVLAAVRLSGSDGILAVFAAGLMFNRFVAARETRHEHAQEAIGRFFSLPVFILIGVMLPWQAWYDLGWSGVMFVLAVMLLRRLPWWLLLKPLAPEMKTMPEAAFLGWFGPIGVSTIYYAILAREQTGNDAAWTVSSLVVFASVILHGITATPLTQLYGRHRERSASSPAGERNDEGRQPPSSDTDANGSGAPRAGVETRH